MSAPGVGAAQRPAEGESVCGDAYFASARGEIVTLALADGLGHGIEAATAANLFCDFVRAHEDGPLDEILRGAHAQLRGTRGAAASLLRIDLTTREAHFTGIGNVDLKADSKHAVAPVCMAGIVGARMKRVMVYSFRLAPGDLLLMHSDGVIGLSDLSPYRRRASQDIAEAVVAAFGVSRDDVTCVALRV